MRFGGYPASTRTVCDEFFLVHNRRWRATISPRSHWFALICMIDIPALLVHFPSLSTTNTSEFGSVHLVSSASTQTVNAHWARAVIVCSCVDKCPPVRICRCMIHSYLHSAICFPLSFVVRRGSLLFSDSFGNLVGTFLFFCRHRPHHFPLQFRDISPSVTGTLMNSLFYHILFHTTFSPQDASTLLIHMACAPKFSERC